MKHNNALDIEQLLADYERQVNSDGKHAYSETTHHDDSSGCGLCDCISGICNICACCTWFSSGDCCW